MEFLDIPAEDRHHVENLGDFYAVIVAIEKVEKAYKRDLVSVAEYEAVLRRLLDKYHSILGELRLGGNRYFDNEGAFWDTYAAKFVAARRRVTIGHPQDAKEAERSAAEAAKAPVDPKLVLECAQGFITLMDCVKLNQTAVDQLFPIFTDLMRSLHRFRGAAEQFSFLPKLQGWIDRLSRMHPSDELGERDAREFAFDLERAYNGFYCSLGEGKG
jgi:ESCRT-I complex subunit VPS28